MLGWGAHGGTPLQKGCFFTMKKSRASSALSCNTHKAVFVDRSHPKQIQTVPESYKTKYLASVLTWPASFELFGMGSVYNCSRPVRARGPGTTSWHARKN